MNRSLLLIATLSFCHLFAIAQPLKVKTRGHASGENPKPQYRVEATEYKPLKAQEFYYSTFTKKYELSYNIAYTYNANGKEAKIEKRNTSNVLQSVTENTYHSNGNLKTTETKDYNNGSVSYGYRYTYDEGYSLIKSETYSSGTGTWTVNTSTGGYYGSQSLYDTLSDGTTIEIYQRQDSNGVYVNSDKYEQYYNSKKEVVTYIYSKWDGTNWVPETKSYDIVWNNFEKYFATSYKVQTWNGTQWVASGIGSGSLVGKNWVDVEDTVVSGTRYPKRRYTNGTESITHPNGYEESYHKTEEYINGKWMVTYESGLSKLSSGGITDTYYSYSYSNTGDTLSVYKDVSEYDPKGNLIYSSNESFSQGFSNYGSRTYNTYDQNNSLVSAENEYLDQATLTWTKSTKTIFSNFVPFIDPTGLNGMGIHELNQGVYPNPSGNGIFNLVESCKFTLTDQNGTQVLTSFGTTIDLSLHSKGVYIASLERNGAVTKRKLVVQ